MQNRDDDYVLNKKEEKIVKYIKRGGVIGIGFILSLLFFLFFCFYSFSENEQAVITTFGKPEAVTVTGGHVKWPFIQEVHIVTKETRGISIGYDLETNVTIDRESVMITSDYNFVSTDFNIEYYISDPIKFLYNSSDPIGILKNLAQSIIRDTIGSYTVDEVITDGKSAIQAEVKAALINRMNEEDIGVMVQNVSIQDAEPPTTSVNDAFKKVETAKQGKETAINNANKYASEKLPAAKAQADSIVKSAEAEKQSRINEGQGQTKRFSEMYNEYVKYPGITKQRMFYETMEEVLPKMQIIIDNGNGTNTIIPSDILKGGQ